MARKTKRPAISGREELDGCGLVKTGSPEVSAGGRFFDLSAHGVAPVRHGKGGAQATQRRVCFGVTTFP